MLTWLQAAVEVNDDHDETAQAHGKHQPDDLLLPHPDSSGIDRRAGGADSCQGSRWGLRTCLCLRRKRRRLLDHRHEHRRRSLSLAASCLPAHPCGVRALAAGEDGALRSAASSRFSGTFVRGRRWLPERALGQGTPLCLWKGKEVGVVRGVPTP